MDVLLLDEILQARKNLVARRGAIRGKLVRHRDRVVANIPFLPRLNTVGRFAFAD